MNNVAPINTMASFGPREKTSCVFFCITKKQRIQLICNTDAALGELNHNAMEGNVQCEL